MISSRKYFLTELNSVSYMVQRDIVKEAPYKFHTEFEP